MKKNKLVNIVIIMIVVFMVLFIARGTVSADDNNTDYINLTGTITNGNNTSATPNNNTTNNSLNDSLNNSSNNSVLTTNNTVNNEALPNTGIESSISVVVLVIILGISAIYAYNKIQDYKNI